MTDNTNLKGIAQTTEWFRRAVPEPNTRTFEVQLGVHLEEIAEMLTALGLPNQELHTTSLDLKQGHYTDFLDNGLKMNPVRIELLDALGDQSVTNTGLAYMLGMDLEGALDEINRSNFTKFDSEGMPLKNEQGKIIKKPDTYEPPELKPFANLFEEEETE